MNGETPSRDPRALDGSLASAVKWMSVARLLAQLLTWLVSIFVARLLTPGDFGIVGMSSVYLGLLVIAAEFGLGSALVAHRDLTPAQLAAINTLAVLLGVAGMALGAASAGPLAAFFRTPALVAIVPVVSLNFLLVAFRTVPLSLLQRDLRFREVALIDFWQSVILAAATLVLAIAGAGFWSLVIGPLIGNAAYTGFSMLRRPIGFARLHLDTLGPTLRLSRDVLGARLSWYVFQNADRAVIGRTLGDHALGIYTMGWNLALLPLEKLTSITVNVAPSIFSAARADPALLRRYLLLLTSALLLVTLPATVGIALVAPELVTALLGPQWSESVLPLRLLAVYAALRCLDPLWTQFLTVTEDARFAFRRNLVAAVVLPVVFIVASRWGVVGVAAAWMIAHPLIIVVPLFRRVTQRLSIPLRDQFDSMAPAVISCGVMAGSVVLLRLVVLPNAPPMVRLVAGAGVGATVYGALLATAFRSRIRDVVHTLRLAPRRA
jgi:PST family polysaccharide transporter